MADRFSPGLYGEKEEDNLTNLTSKIDELSKRLLGEDVELNGLVPKDPSDIARQEIALTRKEEKQTRKALPSIFESYLNRISTGSLSAEEAAESFFNLGRSVRGDIGKLYKQADVLRQTTPGLVSAQTYDRYKPAASLAYEQLLGRPLSDQEFQKYTSAAQGLGISKGPDFQAFLGEALLSTPEYKSQAVVFDPKKVAVGMKALDAARRAPGVKEYASMLGMA